MNFKLPLYFLVFALSYLSIFGQSSSNFLIQSIRYVGASPSLTQSLPDPSQLKSKVGYKINHKLIQDDINTLFLEGSFKSVSANITEKSKNFVFLDFVFTENPKVKNIKFSGLSAFDKKDLTTLLDTKTNSVLNINHITTDKQRITSFFQDNGYDLFTINSIVFSDDNTLIFDLSEGIINKITFDGLNQVHPTIIHRYLTQKQGLPFNSKYLNQDKKTLYDLGYFHYISSPKLSASNSRVNVAFEVKEKKINTIDLGLQYQEREFLGFLELTKFHSLIPSDQFNGKVQFGRQNQDTGTSYRLKYSQPWIFNKYPLSVSNQVWTSLKQEIASIHSTSRIKDYENTQRTGAKVSLGLPQFHQKIRSSISFTTDSVAPRQTSQFENYQLNSLGFSIQYSPQQLNKFHPTNGVFWKIDVSKGGNYSVFDLGGLDFSRVLFNVGSFIPLTSKHVIGLHSKAGVFHWMKSSSKRFESENFILGGSSSIRGYNEADYPFFGQRMLLLNMEYRYLISKKWQWAVFFDIGNAFDNSLSLDWNQFEKGFGTGIRTQSPLGVIRLDVARGRQNTYLHLGLGQVF